MNVSARDLLFTMSSYHSGIELPAPEHEQVKHSSLLIESIMQHIEACGGVISFRDYMQHCLYQPGLGYYSAGSSKFGASGDFVTAPEISSLFGQCLANQCCHLFACGLQNHILEFGAGSGKLCVDIISHLNQLNVDWSSYQILELSSDLRERQKLTLQKLLPPDDFDKVNWLSSLPENFNGLVIGNEVLDAMPVNVVLKNNGWVELGVTFKEHKFSWTEFSRGSEAVHKIQQIDADNHLPEHYCSELNLNYQPWLNSLQQSCDQAVVLLIDYGYSQNQYYHPQRVSGTLVCFYQHRVHPDPLIYPGLQDITAFVDFDALADAAVAAGFSVSRITTQAEFLLENGLLDLADLKNNDQKLQLELAQQVKMLTLPGEMGEKFKVIKLQKNINFLK